MRKVLKIVILFTIISVVTYILNTIHKYIKIIMGFDNNNKKTLKINQENFNEFDNFKKPTIICFSAPWCPACNKFRPIWKDFSGNDMNKETDIKELKNIGVNVVFFNYVGKNIELSEKYDIDAFPTIRLYHNDKVIEYEDEWSKEGLNNFAKNYVNSKKV